MDKCPKLIWKRKHTSSIDFINAHEVEPTINFMTNIVDRYCYKLQRQMIPNTFILEYEIFNSEHIINIYKVRPNESDCTIQFDYEYYKKLVNPSWTDMVEEFKDCNICYATKQDELCIKKYCEARKREFYNYLSNLNQHRL